MPVLEDVLLRLELLGRLVVPAVLVGEPVLDRPDPRLGGLFAQLRLDERARSLGLGPRACVDEDRLVVARDGEAPTFELLGKLAGLRAEVEPETLEQALGMLFLDIDPDAPVVSHEAILA